MAADSSFILPPLSLTERDRRTLWHPYTQEKTAPAPLGVRRGNGVWLELADGRRILDGISSWWVNIHGHSRDYLNEALAKQARELEHVIFAGFTHEPAVKLGEKLIEILPNGLTRVFYSDNGSTAVEVALKMAWQYWQNHGETRTTFVALKNAYHGDTFGAMAASDESSFTAPFQNLLFNVLRADLPAENFISAANGSEQVRLKPNLVDILRENAGQIAAVIVEPMLQGAGGMIMYSAAILKEIRDLCDEHNVLLICDEVLTGFGRTGKMFASEHAEITPDIICLSKALTAGYLPLGVTAAKEKIYEAFLSDDRAKTFFHGHSFTANPLACAVAIASLELFEQDDCLTKITRINQKFHERLPALQKLEVVRDARIIGAIIALELKDDGGYLANIGQRLFQEFLERDILLRPLGNVLYFMPPYVTSETEIDWVLHQIEDVLSEPPA